MTRTMHSDLDLLISADSHVIENPDLWVRALPASLRADAPRYAHETISQAHPGGRDPRLRLEEMAKDGLAAEVLYPSLLLDQFAMTDIGLQEACFRIYNDWLADYCSIAPEQLFGVAAISAYNIQNAIAEMHRCREIGLRGIMIWQVPPDRLSFTTTHYDRLWAAAQEARIPVSLHILTGTPYPAGFAGNAPRRAREFLDVAVNQKLLHASNALRDLIISGALERFPRLPMVFVENEVSWMPFVISQFDKYLSRSSFQGVLPRKPSNYFERQVYSTFFDDPPSQWIWDHWGENNCMWSNDYPHPNSTWPQSKDVLRRDLAHLGEDKRRKLTSGNVIRLYGLDETAIRAAYSSAPKKASGLATGRCHPLAT